MTNYTKTTDFAAKDALPSGNSAKIVKGSEIDTEFNNIATSSATKANANDAALTGTTTFETISDGTISITAFVDEDNMASDSATLVPTQQSVKAYVDSQVTAQDLDVTDGSTSIDIDLDSESLGILGGTGIDSTASGTGVTLAIDSTVATLTGSQTLSNKTLSAPVVSGNLTTDGLLDGRDVAADGTKLDGIEASADVTDTANVTAAGALMDSELTDIAAVKALNQGVATTDSPTFAGLTTTADVSFGDNDKAIFGSGSDLQIYHDGSTSIIKDAGTGELQLHAENNLRLQNLTGSTYALFSNGAAASLYYNGSAKLATTSTGIDVTGVITTDGMTTSADINFGDNDKAVFGASSDLQIYHDGSHSRIVENGTGNLYIYGEDISLFNNSAESYLTAISNGAVTLYHDNAAKLATTSTGIDVTGVITTDGMTTSADINFADNAKAIFGAGSDLEIFSDGTNGRISLNSAAGNLRMLADEFQLANTGYTNFYLTTTAADAVLLYHGGDQKFETTSTGIDVTGTITADGLTVSPSGTQQVLATLRANSGAGGGLVVQTDASDDGLIRGYDSSGNVQLQFDTDGGDNYIAQGNVGIGISSPSGLLHVASTGAANIKIEDTDNGFAATELNVENGGRDFKITTPQDTIFVQGSTEAMRIDASGNVGIGVSSLVTGSSRRVLQVSTGSDGGQIAFADSTTEAANPRIFATNKSDLKLSSANSGSSTIQFITGTTPAERMRIDASGNLLVGKTASSYTTDGFEALAAGAIQVSDTSTNPVGVNRNGTDGSLISFFKSGASVGSIASNSDTSNAYMIIGKGAVGLQFARDADANNIMPARPDNQSLRDNAIDLGSSSFRFDDIYATNGTIQTSDRNEKQDIEVLSDAEQRVAVAAKGLLRKFRWISSVEENGDDARIHFGIIAQDLQAAFEAEGLDAGRYGMFINTTWTDEETGEERSRMGVRYSELLAFIIAAI